MGKKRAFSVDYKKEIIKLVTEQGKKVIHVAKDIDISQATVRRWVKEYGIHGNDAFPGKGKLRLEDEKIKRIKKKMADLEEENTTLKKLSAPHKSREIRYKFIYGYSSEFHVEKMCKLLDIKRSSYYS